MRRKPTYQELANTTLATTQLGAVTQPYVPFNDNALAVQELRTMTDKLAQEARANQGTQAHPLPRQQRRACHPLSCKGWWGMPKSNGV